MLLALFLALQTLVGKDEEATSGLASRGMKEGACQEQMRPVCLFQTGVLSSSELRPPLSARGAKEAPWEPARECCAGLRESQAPSEPPSPSQLQPVSEMHGGIKCSPN